MEVSASAMQDGDGGGDNEEAMDAADGAVTASHGAMAQLLRHLRSLEIAGTSYSPEGVTENSFQKFKSDIKDLCTNLKNLAVEDNLSLMAKRWMDEVRNLCYDTEDYFDKVQHSGADLGKSAPCNQTSSEFSELMDRAECAGKRYKSFVLPAQPIKSNQEYKEASSSSSFSYSPIVEPSSSVFDDMVKHLAFDNNKQFKVVSILGYAGVGKSTLARRLYRRFGDRFQCRAFVRVSRNPDIRTFLFSVLSQIKEPHTDVPCDVQTIFGNIKAHLQHRRYLIVIDDLWSSPTWDIINRAFPRDNGYSRIITTTHIENVAKACCSYNSTNIFRMELLYPPELSGLSFETTIMVVKLLRCNITIEQQGHLQNSLLSSLRTNPTPEGMKELLNLIYGILPHHLKTCLLYFSMYPENYTIKKNDLVKQWVAEGFVSAVNGQAPDMIAEIYFDELISRGLIEKVDTKYHQVLSCTVHHVVSDFIRNKSREENFITIADYFQTTPGNSDKVRRLSAQFGGAKGAKIPRSVRMSQLRSLIYFGFFECLPTVSQYNLLRVLILHIWDDKDKSINLSSICELFRLRYLKIVCNVRVNLPAEIGRLQYLETLDLDTRVVGFPSDIAHLQQLLHLRLPRDPNMLNVLDLGKLTNLQDLHLTCSGVQNDRVAVNMESLWSILEKFSKLKSLIIDGDVLPIGKDAGASATSIPVDCLSIVSCPPPHLQKLELSSKSYIFPSLPEWIAQPSKLSILKIAVRNLLRNNVQILNRLTALTVLSLYVCNAPAGGVVFYEEFKNLKYFKFNCTAPCLTFVEGAMVKVERLKLCFNADSIEQYDLTLVGFQYLTSLKEISVKFEDPNSSNSGNAESALVDAVSKHPGEPILNVEPKEETFYGDQEKNVSAQKQNPQIPERQVTITDRDSGDQRVQQKKRKRTAVEKEETQILMGQNVVEGKVTGKQHEDRQNTSSEDTVIQEDRKKKNQQSLVNMNLLNTTVEVIGGVNDFVKLFQWVKDCITYMRSRWKGVQEQKLQEDVIMQLQSDLKRLKDTLPAMYDLINRAEWRIHEKCVADLLPNLKDAVYDAEDLLGEFRSYEMKVEAEGNTTSEEAESNTTQLLLSDTIDFFCSVIQGNFNKVTNIQNRLNNVSSLLEKKGLHESAPRFDKTLRPETTSFHTEEKIFGRVEELEEMIRLLGVTRDNSSSSKRKRTASAAHDTSSIASVPVLPIVGIGGVGKTTFAQKITTLPRVKSHFDKIIWICFSDEFDNKRLIKRVIKSLSGKEATADNLEDLQRDLKDKVRKKRFLLILDDIWPDALNLKDGKQCWLNFYGPLKNALQGSMLLVTTRFDEVADKVGTMDPFKLEGLKADVFWDFFKVCAFGSKVPKNHLELEKIGRSIVPKLKGTPLAAKTIGRLLGHSLNTEHWTNILQSELWKISQKKTEILPALRLSYMYLPFHLKRCFSFCSVYPKDHNFEKANLVEIWVAEGFVEPESDTPLKHIGERYFQELVHLSFFQKLRDAYVIHDLMHDMAQHVLGDECFIVKNASDFEKIPESVRHLSILKSSQVNRSNLLDLCKKTKLRTLLCDKSISSFDSVMNKWFDELQCIRVIRISSKLPFPASICKMKHLRYIEVVSANSFTSITTAFSCPYSLQFLYARECRLEILPSNFSNLTDLQTFESANFWYHRDGEIRINEENLGLIRNANKLRGDLIIQDLSEVTKDKAAEADLKNKECLNKLALRWELVYQQNYDDVGVLQALHPHTNLKYLHLESYRGKSLTHQEGSSSISNFGIFPDLIELTILYCYSLPSFDELLTHHCLPAIKKICVDGCSSLQSLTDARFDSFPSLEDLHIQDCKNLKWEKGNLLPSSLRRLSLQACGDISDWFPSCLENVGSLESLVLISCKQVMSIPGHLWSSNLASLQELRIQDCPDLVSIGERNSIAKIKKVIANIEKVYISGCPKLKGRQKTFSKGGLKKEWKETYFQRIKFVRWESREV